MNADHPMPQWRSSCGRDVWQPCDASPSVKSGPGLSTCLHLHHGGCLDGLKSFRVVGLALGLARGPGEDGAGSNQPNAAGIISGSHINSFARDAKKRQMRIRNSLRNPCRPIAQGGRSRTPRRRRYWPDHVQASRLLQAAGRRSLNSLDVISENYAKSRSLLEGA